MLIVINIPQPLKEAINIDAIPEETVAVARLLINAVKNGIVIPAGHGKIIDADKIEWYGCMSEEYCPHKNTECKDCVRAECDKRQVDAITAIVEADGAITN